MTSQGFEVGDSTHFPTLKPKNILPQILKIWNNILQGQRCEKPTKFQKTGEKEK
jgi:hypothetical protein